MKLAMKRAMLTSNSPRVAEIDERLEALQKELLKKANAKQGFEELADGIDALLRGRLFYCSKAQKCKKLLTFSDASSSMIM